MVARLEALRQRQGLVEKVRRLRDDAAGEGARAAVERRQPPLGVVVEELQDLHRVPEAHVPVGHAVGVEVALPERRARDAEQRLHPGIVEAVVPPEVAARERAAGAQVELQRRAVVGLGAAEVHRVLGVRAHEPHVLAHVGEGAARLEDEQVVTDEDARLAARVEGGVDGLPLGAAVEVAGAVLRGVLDAHVEPQQAQRTELPRELRGHRLRTALAHEPRAPDAVAVEGRAHRPHPRQRGRRLRQQEVVVVEAEDRVAARGMPEHRHLLRDVLRASQPHRAPAAVIPSVAVERRDRAIGARAPAPAAAHDRDERHAQVLRVRAVAPREGQHVEVLLEAAPRRAHRRARRVAVRQARDVRPGSAVAKRREQRREGHLAVVQHHRVEAVRGRQRGLPRQRRVLPAGGDVPREPHRPQPRRECEKFMRTVLELHPQPDDVGLRLEGATHDLRGLRRLVEREHRDGVPGGLGGCRDHPQAEVLLEVGPDQ